MSDIQIYHVTFHDGGVEVVYSEDRDIGERVMVQRTIAIPMNIIHEEIIDLLDTLQEAVDKGLIDQQNLARKERPQGLNKRMLDVNRTGPEEHSEEN